jgi:hypothetical protein
LTPKTSKIGLFGQKVPDSQVSWFCKQASWRIKTPENTIPSAIPESNTGVLPSSNLALFLSSEGSVSRETLRVE